MSTDNLSEAEYCVLVERCWRSIGRMSSEAIRNGADADLVGNLADSPALRQHGDEIAACRRLARLGRGRQRLLKALIGLHGWAKAKFQTLEDAS